jgi:hypothetical protein
MTRGLPNRMLLAVLTHPTIPQAINNKPQYRYLLAMRIPPQNIMPRKSIPARI